ncbi:glycosyltransferase family 4 protein [Flavobacterium tegetincola]|uniref:glycosyltransferase family 4 protein n=1 Tax=Flavobacterium tegetincola TaxID=150172 RepID=UPI00041B8ED1|nr:glycosyltransferase family 4 protein [Flavobacterium tegetincola]
MRLIQFTAADGWRGHEQKIIYLYEAFQEFGLVEDQWIICRNDSEIFKVATEKKLQVLGYDFKSEYDTSFAKKLKNISHSLNADVLFMHSSKAHTLGVLSSLLYGMKTKMVLCRTMIERVDTNFFRKWKYNYKGIQKIICVSQPVVDILKFAVKDASRMSIVGSVTDIRKFENSSKKGYIHEKYAIPHDYKIVGNIAAFTPMKDLVTWVNTVEELVKRKVKAKYVLIGEGPLEAEIKELVKVKGLENDIIFAGFVKNVPEYLPEFDVLLFTSINEPTGGVILESYACHVPVVGTDAGGIPTVIMDKVTGLLARKQDAVDFADKVLFILENQEERDNMVANGYKFLLETGTKEVIARKMMIELEAVL